MINNNELMFTNVFQAQTCVGSSYKNKSSISPCTPCHPQTKSASVYDENNTTEPITMCIPCETDSFCPLGATGDVNLSNVASYTQTFVYRTGGTTNEYDDLLLQFFLLLE